MSFINYIGLMLGLVVIVTPLFYWTSRSRFGPRIAREQIPEIIIGTTSLVVFVTLNNATKGEQWSAIKAFVWSSFAALLWITFAMLALRRPRTSEVLLNLGRLHKGQVWLLLFFGSIGTIALLMGLGLPSDSTSKAEVLSICVWVWSFGIVLALMSRKGTLFTEEGIRTGYIGFSWDQIKEYIWSDMNKDHHYLLFKIKRRLPLANTSILDVPSEVRQAVNDIVIQRTSLNVRQQTTTDSQ